MSAQTGGNSDETLVALEGVANRDGSAKELRQGDALARDLGITVEELDRRVAAVAQQREARGSAVVGTITKDQLRVDDLGGTAVAQRDVPRYMVRTHRDGEASSPGETGTLETDDPRAALAHFTAHAGKATVVDRSLAPADSTVAWSDPKAGTAVMAPAFQEAVDRAADLVRARAGERVTGVMEFDGQSVSAVGYERHGSGADQRFSLSLQSEGRGVATLDGLTRDGLDAAVGKANAAEIYGGARPVGALAGKSLQYAAGGAPVLDEAERTEMPRAGVKANAIKDVLPATSDVDEIAKQRSELQAAVEKRYLRSGASYYFKDNNNKLAFEDLGGRMVTAEKDSRVAESMAQLADAKGWTSIKVNGTREFQREVWLAASLRGIKVQGYAPQDVDRALLKEKMDSKKTNSVEVAQGQDKKTPEPTASNIEASRRREQSREDYNLLRPENRQRIDKTRVVEAVAGALGSTIRNPDTRAKVLTEVTRQLEVMSAKGKDVPTIHTYDKSAPSRARDTDHNRGQVERRTERTR